jgi:hypothetical protein
MLRERIRTLMGGRQWRRTRKSRDARQTSPGALDLVNFERHRFLLRFGYHF